MILMVKGDLMVTSRKFGNLDIRNGQGVIWDIKHCLCRLYQRSSVLETSI